jgi:glycosyltransferase involved in cell wall biosynthesis
LYQAAIALVYPSFYEGFGFPPLEAMRFGTPVVTSSVSSLPEVAGQAAILVNPYDIAEIATALGRIYIDPQLCHRMVEQGKKSAQKFSWQTAARQYLDLFQEILA